MRHTIYSENSKTSCAPVNHKTNEDPKYMSEEHEFTLVT